jgi:MraZ protein
MSMTLFTGEYEIKLDAKGRMTLPARVKAQLPQGEVKELMIMKGFEPCLILYPMVEFKKVYSKISALNEFNEEYRTLQRNFLSGVDPVELDAAGRFVIPKNLLTYAKLDKDVLLMGVGNKLEIWTRAQFESYRKEQKELSKMAGEHLVG